MHLKRLNKRILVSITGYRDNDWQSKLAEINRFKLNRVALFLEMYKPKQRQKIYQALLTSSVQDIPFVHLKEDVTKDEIKFLIKNFNSQCFNIHENFFRSLEKWKGYYKKFYLEMNYDDFVDPEVQVSKIAGFCIDLSHFKAAMDRGTAEYDFIMKRKNNPSYFRCNHLNGYNPKLKKDIHTITNLKQFDYLKDLPSFLFGEYIAIETFNSIKEQLGYKDYLIKFLK